MLRFGRDSRSAQLWLRPPRLRTLSDVEEERHASWLELFFDLVFVVAIVELSHELVVNHTLNGFASFAALFVPVFVAWQGFSFYADRFDTDDVFFRVCMLAAMLAVAALAIQIPGVAHGESSAGLPLPTSPSGF
jgi:low temperature requirement protein LtrA